MVWIWTWSSVENFKMKVSAVVLTLAICVAFYHRGVEASVSKCYYCVYTCNNPLDEQTCPNSDLIDYRCISSRAEGDGQVLEAKGCVLASDTVTAAQCDRLDDQSGGSCFICDTDLCNSAGIYSMSVLLVSCLVILTKLLWMTWQFIYLINFVKTIWFIL
jgi:hypothetical protein